MRLALRDAARAELARRAKAAAKPPTIVEYVAELRPNWDRFDYFAPYARELERAIRGDLRICFAAPPQHGKTVFTLHGLTWICRYRPGYRHGYVTYNDDRAKTVAKQFRRIAIEAGFQVGGTLDLVELRFEDGLVSTVRFTSIGGGLTGDSLDGLCVVDDPIKDREEARSPAHRRQAVEWWESVARTRRHPGTSYVVMATRWPGGDLTHYLTTKKGWQYINLKAIATGAVNDNGVVEDDPLGRRPGESLWSRKPPEFFKEDQADLFWWAAMYQGEPQAEGMRLFAEPGTKTSDGRTLGPRFYRRLPDENFRAGFGVDLAYTAKTSADWSICIEGVEHEGLLYIVNVYRKQVDAPSFLLTLISCRSDRPNANFRFYAAGTEKGAADFIKKKIGSTFRVITASADKLVRATPASANWNQGKILLPESAPWLDEFLAVVCSFSGTPGEKDDDVDALSALHDELMTVKKRREFFGAAEGGRSDS